MKSKLQNTDKQNDITTDFFKSQSLTIQQEELFVELQERCGFVADKVLGKSRWWNSERIAAMQVLGQFQGKMAIAKIQGTRQKFSEAWMIREFERVNTSSQLRPPELYDWLEWSDEYGYEVLILEYVGGKRLVQQPPTLEQIHSFFNFLQEYRMHCLQEPWLQPPDESISSKIVNNFDAWRLASTRLFPDHPLRNSQDEMLIAEAQEVLVSGYQDCSHEFMHGHLSLSDVVQFKGKLVVLSNLYWSYRAPYYDLVFGYHWQMLEMGNEPEYQEEVIEEASLLWKQVMKDYLYHAKALDEDLLNLCLLERAAAAVIIDGLMMKPSPAAVLVMEMRREEIRQLMSVL